MTSDNKNLTEQVHTDTNLEIKRKKAEFVTIYKNALLRKLGPIIGSDLVSKIVVVEANSEEVDNFFQLLNIEEGHKFIESNWKNYINQGTAIILKIQSSGQVLSKDDIPDQLKIECLPGGLYSSIIQDESGAIFYISNEAKINNLKFL